MKYKIANIKDIAKYDTLSAKKIIAKIEEEQEKELVGLMADEMRGIVATVDYQYCQNCSGHTDLTNDIPLCNECVKKGVKIKEVNSRNFFVLDNKFVISEEIYLKLKKRAHEQKNKEIQFIIEENKRIMKKMHEENIQLEKYLKQEENKDE